MRLRFAVLTVKPFSFPDGSKTYKHTQTQAQTQTHRDTQRHTETKRDTERHGETQRDAERHRETQRDTERHRETQRDTHTHTHICQLDCAGDNILAKSPTTPSPKPTLNWQTPHPPHPPLLRAGIPCRGHGRHVPEFCSD